MTRNLTLAVLAALYLSSTSLAAAKGTEVATIKVEELKKFDKAFEKCVAQEVEKKKKTDVDTFENFSAKLGQGTDFLSAEVVSAFSRFREGEGGFPSGPRAVGIRITSSIPPDSSTRREYGDHALMLRDGGILNGHFSLIGSPKWFEQACTDQALDVVKKKGPSWFRTFQADRVYLARHPVPRLLRPYLVNGIGIKAVRTGLEDREGEDASGVDAVGSAYFGLGLNGPIWDPAASNATPAGTLDLQIAAQVQRLNSSTLSDLYGVPSDERWIYSSSVRLSVVVSEKISLALEYAGPVGSSKGLIGDVTVFSVGYLNPN